MMEAYPCDKSVRFYHTTQGHTPKGGYLRSHSRERNEHSVFLKTYRCVTDEQNNFP